MIPESMLIDGFRALLETAEGPHFLRAPMIEPDTRWFPDAWTPDQDGIHRLLRRVMFYAGLGEMPLSIERFVFDAEEDESAAPHGRHVIAFFKGISDGRCEFGINCAQLGDPEHLIGVLAHEVAHAFRAVFELVKDDDEEEERLTDLTTIFLGFGVLTTNNAHRSTVYDNWRSVRESGYLSAQAMAFALAVWTHTRRMASDVDIAERWLEPRQRSMFTTTHARLSAARVHDRLRIPKKRIAAPRRSSILDDAPPARDGAEPIDFAAKRSDTFRIQVRPQRFASVAGFVVGAMATPTMFAASAVSGVSVLAAVVCAAVGFGLGRLLARDECARHSCTATIPAKMARCPRCGAMVQGELKDGASVDDAFDDLRRRRAAARRSAP
jgi:hypothetical protein